MKELTLGSLFDGIGGFPLAASRYGIKTLWASEIEPFPIKVTKIRLPDMKHLGDITKINGAEIEPVDIITFGSPCQDLSVAGKRAGLAGERSGLFMEAVRIIKEMRNTYDGTNEPIRPRFAVWENVPGAFSSNKGEDFRAVLEEICRVKDETVIIPKPPKGKWSTVGAIMGNGWSIAWRVLDAQFWGVPQRRRRIFLVADFGGQSAPEILFKRKGLSRYSQESREAREGTSDNVERSIGKASHIVKIPVYDIGDRRSVANESIDNSPTLTARMGTGGNNVPVFIEPQSYCLQGSMIGRADKNGPQGDGINEDVSFTLNTTDRHAVATKAYGIGAYNSEGMKSNNPYSGIYEANTSRTIDLNGGSPACNQGGMAIVTAFTQNQREEVRDLQDKAGALAAEPGTHRIKEGNMIENKLREYKSNLSKLKLIECSMKQIESEIQVLEPSYISAYAFSDTPPIKTNKFSSVVENSVIDSENRREAVDKLKEQLWDMAKERLYLQCKVEEVQAYLTALGAEEKFIIEQFYFEKLTWRIVAERYRKEFGNYISRDTLRKKKKAAIRQMGSIEKSPV